MSNKKEKYIVTKALSMGYIRISCPIGTIIDVDRENAIMTINGNEYKDLRDLDIAIRVNDKKGKPIVIPYVANNPAIKEILQSVKTKLAEKQKEEKETMPVVLSDSDLVGDIDIGYTKVAKKEAAEKPKNGKLEVIRESESTVPIAKRVEEELKQKVENVYNRPKMKIIRDGQDTGKKSIAETAKAKTKAPKASIELRKKG